jgi:hypothetical protein
LRNCVAPGAGPGNGRHCIAAARLRRFTAIVAAWQLGADRVLHLQYVNPQLAPRGYTLSRDGSALTLTARDGESFVAELQEGDRLPYY